jgi:hypothetical protein
VCGHPDAIEINEALVIEKRSIRAIASQHGVDRNAVQRHRQHIPELLMRAARAEEVAEADTLLDRLEDLHRRTEAILSRVEETDNYVASLGAIREMRRNLEVIGELTKELNRSPTVNLSVNPEWLELRAVIIGALEPHPQARQDVLTAIRSKHELGSSNGLS